MFSAVPTDKPRLTTYVSVELKSAVEQWADAESRTVSSQIENLLDSVLIKKDSVLLRLQGPMRLRLEASAKEKSTSLEQLIEWIIFESLQKEAQKD